MGALVKTPGTQFNVANPIGVCCLKHLRDQLSANTCPLKFWANPDLIDFYPSPRESERGLWAFLPEGRRVANWHPIQLGYPDPHRRLAQEATKPGGDFAQIRRPELLGVVRNMKRLDRRVQACQHLFVP